jgi:hypothetical protein
MNEPAAAVVIDMRIPGRWAHPGELIERLPEGCRLTGKELILADGTQVDFGAAPPDDQFAGIFRSSCRQPPTEEERKTVDRYTVNIYLSGPGGSLEAAHNMMRAAAAIVRAGGAGVFIDNGALAHGGQNWLEMTDDGGSDALSFAFVGIIAGKSDVWTMGMHALGFRDIIMKRTDADDFDIVEVIRYVARGDKPIGEGHVLADESGPRFQTFTDDDSKIPAGSPMHNPFGRLKLVSTRDIAGTN